VGGWEESGCEVCGIPLSLARRETCPSPACPCFGTRADSIEMELAAERWRSRPSVAQSRTMTGAAALDALEHRAQLDAQRAYGDVIDIRIEHRAEP
jgi:hypothetical protein